MAGPALDRVLQRVTGLKAVSGGWVARCPAHDDKIQSLQISEREDLSVGLHCHAGCAKQAMLAAMGLTFPDLFSSKEKEIVETYDYRDLDGTLLYQSVRMYPKEFLQRRPDKTQKDGWAWNMLPFAKNHVPYRLPDLKGQNVVVVVEGEKDANRLWKLGIPATTNVGGAEKWTASDTKALVSAGVQRIIIIPDNDPAGYRHALKVGKFAKAQNLAVSTIELPDLGPKQDVSDWLSNGGSKETLEALIAAMPYVLPQMPASPTIINPTPSLPTPEPLPDSLPDPLKYRIGATVGAGAAESFRDRYADRLRFDHTEQSWFVWSGHRWARDDNDEVMRLALEHSRRWGQEVIGAAADFTDRKRWQDYTLKLERRPDRIAMLADARAMPPFAVSGTKWDRDPWLLGVQNGVVDLRTGHLANGNPADYISQQIAAPYGHAECPRWLQFLDEVFNGDKELINFVHRAVGYSLTGDMREQCFFLCTGGGSNGKSKFLSALEAVFGSYGQRATMKLFVGEASDFHMAELVNRRMVFASETKPGLRINEHIVKSLTGGETQQAERKHQHPFKFQPVSKIWLGMNELPKVADDSYGFWRRVRLIPFTQTFSGSTDDKLLMDKLVAELPGILAWAVQGALAWQQDGLVPPAAVMKWTDDYQNAEDPLSEFIAERCNYDEHGIETFSAIFAAYNSWAEQQKIPRLDRLTRRSMGIHLKRRFVEKDLNGMRRYGGIKLRGSLYDGIVSFDEVPDE